jgi:hypothetical protein
MSLCSANERDLECQTQKIKIRAVFFFRQ